jgi:hypothetical protein
MHDRAFGERRPSGRNAFKRIEGSICRADLRVARVERSAPVGQIVSVATPSTAAAARRRSTMMAAVTRVHFSCAKELRGCRLTGQIELFRM